MTLRVPLNDAVKFDEDGLLLKCGTDNLSGTGVPSYVCIRQDSKFFEARVTLYTDNLMMGTRAGLCLFQSEGFHVRFEITENRGRVVLVNNGKEELIAEDALRESPATIIMKVSGTSLSVYSLNDRGMQPFVRDLDISSLSTEVAGGFVGCTVGIFATDGDDREEPVFARFKSFTYERFEPVIKD